LKLIEVRKPVTPGKMTSRERVHAAARGLPVDRVPVMYYFNPHLTCRLMAEMQPGLRRFPNWLAGYLWARFSRGGGLAAPGLWRALPHLLNEYGNSVYALELGADIALQGVGTSSNVQRIYWENKKFRLLDAYGSVRGLGGIYMDIVKPSIGDVKDLKDYRFPDFSADKNFYALRKLRSEHPGASIMVETFGVQDFFSTQIWSMTPFMTALYEYPDEVKDYLQRFGDWSIGQARRGVKAGADMVFIYDDYGYTGRPFISMKMWREFTYPHLKRIIEAVHEAGALCMLHSCGFQTPFLEHYVEAGLDVLQSFQPKAGNDFQEAYGKYGDRLAFTTGIDVQMGEQMSPQEMRESILRSYHTGKLHGRHILGMTHMMQYTMPAQNIQAVFNTVREIQAGEHGT
jgi:uroporphyrinogen decarboxylase